MKKIAVLSAFCLALSACTSLSHHEQNTIRSLNSYGISVDKPAGEWERPALSLIHI
mgnify:CR=1 FL=1